MRSVSLTANAAIEALAVRRPHKFTEERLRAYKFRPRIGTRKPRYAQQRLKTPDALLNSVDARIFSLPEIKRGLFIVRPPPTPVPAEIALPLSAPSSRPHGPQSRFNHPLAAGTNMVFGSLPRPQFKYGTDELNGPIVSGHQAGDTPSLRIHGNTDLPNGRQDNGRQENSSQSAGRTVVPSSGQGKRKKPHTALDSAERAARRALCMTETCEDAAHTLGRIMERPIRPFFDSSQSTAAGLIQLRSISYTGAAHSSRDMSPSQYRWGADGGQRAKKGRVMTTRDNVKST